MIGIKPLLRIVSVLAVAVAAGQAVETLRGPVDAGDAAPPAGALDLAVQPTGMGRVTGITPVAATTEAAVPDACAISLRLTARPGAMIDLALSAPCNAGERVVLRHAGLAFTAMTGPDGRLRQTIPAFAAEAMVAAYLDRSGIALASVTVPDLAAVSRFAVQVPWPAQFALRVDAPGGGGDITRLGAPRMAAPILMQVYSGPSRDLAAIEPSIELRITEDVCGRTIPVATLLAHQGKLTRSSISARLPLCGTNGDILVLKNLLPAPTLDAPR